MPSPQQMRASRPAAPARPLDPGLATDPERLLAAIRRWGAEIGLARIGVAGTDLAADEARLLEWLDAGYHGTMAYMSRHGTRRTRPRELVAGTVSVISASVDYLPAGARDASATLADGERGYVARYALGRDYHRVVRARLKRLCLRIETHAGPFAWRVFSDSAPVLEKPLARDAGIGWIGKHSNLIDRRTGSWFVLGEVYTDLRLPHGEPPAEHCGECRRCIDSCPTGAIVAPWRLDARRCISYLTIEHRGAIPESLRPLVGNRVFGCDDCQLACPWNRFATATADPDFEPRNGLDGERLAALLGWSAEEFDERTRGSPLRRVGYLGWLRNVAVALGNAPPSRAAVAALAARADHPSAMVREHVGWALARQRNASVQGSSE